MAHEHYQDRMQPGYFTADPVDQVAALTEVTRIRSSKPDELEVPAQQHVMSDASRYMYGVTSKPPIGCGRYELIRLKMGNE
ncbi:hypothetical protein GN244_ATG08426 [Phytophthora infestans]|uniref:Uncharacterized protein n=1 Tax=Phytophthora infestans TaxID=4787 RepID=A0A833SD11_PHYIN|nr:hypothetical protein GN244_ATG08426 [Phytophthora infestans]KAF4129927.1 hypothetical protein GN958_ATG20886 [Phytophthora infestans]